VECVVGLNGFQLWVYIVALADGVRLRLALDDWNKLDLDVGRRVPVRVGEKRDV
jgi:hypothetical protein